MNPAFILCALLAITSAPVISSGAAWYVAPHGSDDATGSIGQPFASIQRGQSAAVPGDTVFIRGGTYRMTEADLARRRGLFARLMVLDKSGTKEKPITYRAWDNL